LKKFAVMIGNYLSSLHFGTRCLLLLIVSLHIIQFLLFDPRLSVLFLLNPSKVFSGEIWRLFTSSLFHGGILHLVMNMLAFAQLGVTLESRIGTLSFFYHIFVFSIFTSLVHCLLAMGALFGGEPGFFYGYSVGFSGVLFALIVIDVSGPDPGHRAVFGLFVVPAWLYPWVMLVVMQLIMRRVSFLGHLAGIAVGYAYGCGLFRFVVPSSAWFGDVERRGWCPRQRGGWVGAEGMDSGQYRPWTVFQHRWGRDDEEEVLPRAGEGAFRGRGRTIGGDGMAETAET
jgi:membrane associated rhomboid family serine protease